MFGALNRLVLGQKQPVADARTFSISAFGWSAWSHNRLQGHSNTRHSHSRKSQRKPRRRPNYLEFIAPPPTIAGEESRVNVTGPINSAGIDAGHRVLVCQTIIDANWPDSESLRCTRVFWWSRFYERALPLWGSGAIGGAVIGKFEVGMGVRCVEGFVLKECKISKL